MTKELTAMIAEVRASIEGNRNSIFYWMTRSSDATEAIVLLGVLKEQLTADITTLDKIVAEVEANSYKHDGFVSKQGEDVYKPAEMDEKRAVEEFDSWRQMLDPSYLRSATAWQVVEMAWIVAWKTSLKQIATITPKE